MSEDGLSEFDGAVVADEGGETELVVDYDECLVGELDFVFARVEEKTYCVGLVETEMGECCERLLVLRIGEGGMEIAVPSTAAALIRTAVERTENFILAR